MRKTKGKTLLLTALALLFMVAPVSSQGWPPPPGPYPSGPAGPAVLPFQAVEAWIFQFTNEIRQRHGFAPLSSDETLNALARAYCEDMLRRRFFSHSTPEGAAPKDRIIPAYPGTIYRLGENIWKGFNQDLNDPPRLARFIVDHWMSSPGHRDNILGPYFTHVGLGVAVMGRDIRAVQILVDLKGKNRP